MQSISKPTVSDILLIGLTALIWASSFSALKVVVPETGPYWLATYRVGIGFLALLPFYILSKKQISLTQIPKNNWFLILTVALFNMVYPFIAISWGVKSVDSGVAALLMGTSPIFALVIGHFATNDDKISFYKVIAVTLGIFGIVTILGPSVLSGVGDSPLLGQLAIMSGSVSYVIAGTFMRKLSMPAISFTTIALGLATIALTSVSLLFDGPPTGFVSLNALYLLLWLGIFPTGLAYVFRYYLIQRVGMSTFAIGINLTPIFGVIIGALLLGETITIQIMVALSLVIAALFFARMGTNALPQRANSGTAKP